MKTLLRLFMLGVVLLLVQCAAPAEHQSEERPASRSQALDGQPFVSPEFPVDNRPAGQVNPAAPLLNVAANDDGYLFTYAINGLTFVRWNATTGAASTFATLPSANASTARAIAVDGGWLVVYQAGTRYSVTITADGTVSTPTALPGTCQNGIAGFARSPTTALLSDGCGAGALLDLNGQLLLTFFIVPPLDPQTTVIAPFNWNGLLTGGQVAFNGIDYVVMYGYSSQPYPKAVGVIRVSPSGAVSPVFYVSTPAVPYKGVNPLGLAVNGSTVLLLLKQDRSAGPEFDIAYNTMQEAADHTLTLGNEKYFAPLPANAFDPSDHNATAFALGSRFGIVREDHSGALSLWLFDPTNALPTTNQALLSPFAGAPLALTAATAGRFVVAAGGRGVRFGSAINAIDVPPATLIQSWLPAPAQFIPSFAFDGASYLASWIETASNSAGQGSVRMQRLSNGAQILETASFSPSPAAPYAQDLIANTDAHGFVLAWSDSGIPSTGGARISSNDPLLATPFPQPTSAYISGRAIGSDGDRAAALWTGNAVQMAQFSDAGAWSPSFLIANTAPPHNALYPALVFHEGHFVALWLDVTDDQASFAIYGARVAPDLSPIDSSPKQILRIATTNPRALEAVPVGDQLVLAWSGLFGHGTDPTTEEIDAIRISSTLDAVDPSPIRIATPQIWNVNVDRRIALRWDGASVWLLWLDAASGIPARGGLVGQRFSSALTPVDAAPWLVTNNLDNRAAITLTGGDDGRSLVGYTAFDSDLSSVRVRARFLSATAFADGIPCAAASQCRNGACSAGYCATASGAGGADGQTGGGIAGAGGIANGGGGIANGGGGIANGGGGMVEAGGIANGGGGVANGGGGIVNGGGGIVNGGGGIANGGGGIANGGGGIANGGGGIVEAGGIANGGGGTANGGFSGTLAVAGSGAALAGDAGTSNEAGQVGVAGAGLPSGAAGASNEADGGSPADAGESSGGAVPSGGAVANGGAASGAAAGASGHHSGSCSAAGPGSLRSSLSGLLLLAGALTVVGRRRRRSAATHSTAG